MKELPLGNLIILSHAEACALWHVRHIILSPETGPAVEVTAFLRMVMSVVVPIWNGTREDKPWLDFRNIACLHVELYLDIASDVRASSAG
jgi:hypothetical protein